MYTQRAILQARCSAFAWSDGDSRAPSQTCEFALQVIDSTQSWSITVAERITHTELLAVVASCATLQGRGTSTVYLNYSKPLQPQLFRRRGHSSCHRSKRKIAEVLQSRPQVRMHQRVVEQTVRHSLCHRSRRKPRRVCRQVRATTV